MKEEKKISNESDPNTKQAVLTWNKRQPGSVLKRERDMKPLVFIMIAHNERT